MVNLIVNSWTRVMVNFIVNSWIRVIVRVNGLGLELWISLTSGLGLLCNSWIRGKDRF